MRVSEPSETVIDTGTVPRKLVSAKLPGRFSLYLETRIVTDPSKPPEREEGVIVTVLPAGPLPGVKVRLPTMTLSMAAGTEPEFFIVSVILIVHPLLLVPLTATVGVPIIWTPALVFPKLPNRPKAKTATALSLIHI